MKRILILAGCLLIFGQTNAQRYRTAAGIRLGDKFGISVQQKIFEQSTIEGILQVPIRNTDDTKLTLLYEQHRKLIGKRLNFYYGIGAHKGWAASEEDPDPSGVSLVAGLEISLGRMNLSMDYKPSINVISGARFFEGQSAMTVRYIFVERKKKKINWKFWKKKD